MTPSQKVGTCPTSSYAFERRPRSRRPTTSSTAVNAAASRITWTACVALPLPATAVASASRPQAVTSSIAALAECERAHRPLQHPSLDQDPRENREGSDRHRDAHEEGERQVTDVRREQRVDRQRDEEAEPQRECDARVRDEGGLPDPALQHARFELHPDQEEVEHEADLRRAGEKRHDVRREEVALRGRPDERRGGSGRGGSRRAPRPSPAAGRARLVTAPTSACGKEHGGDCEHQPSERLLARPLRRRLRRRAGRRQRSGERGGRRRAADLALSCFPATAKSSGADVPSRQCAVPFRWSPRSRSLPDGPPPRSTNSPDWSRLKVLPRHAEDGAVEARDRGRGVPVMPGGERNGDRRGEERERRRRSPRQVAPR